MCYKLAAGFLVDDVEHKFVYYRETLNRMTKDILYPTFKLFKPSFKHSLSCAQPLIIQFHQTNFACLLTIFKPLAVLTMGFSSICSPSQTVITGLCSNKIEKFKFKLLLIFDLGSNLRLTPQNFTHPFTQSLFLSLCTLLDLLVSLQCSKTLLSHTRIIL